MKLDKWQQEVMQTKGNIVLRSGRQVGKSTIISIKAGDYALENKNKTIMIIAKVERQALLLFEKVLAHIYEKDKQQICKGGKKPTKHKLQLKNGSVIHCLPAGESGYGIRGFTIDLLIVDEAAFIMDAVWSAITPMLATTGGDMWLLSTPYGKQGYFHKCFSRDNFTKFHLSNPEVAAGRDPAQRKRMDEHREEERKSMSEVEYAQEYLGEFVDDLRQFFPDALIENICILGRLPREREKDYFLGSDIAGMGKDETTYAILDGTSKDRITHMENIVKRKQRTTQTTRDIIYLERLWDFNKIGLDDAGMGVGVFDQLLITDNVKRKIIALNNSSRWLDKDKKKKKKLLKEDMYNNLNVMMESGKIKLLNDEEVKQSLKSVQAEYVNNKLRLFGKDTHIVEGIIRAAWCIKIKGNGIWVR